MLKLDGLKKFEGDFKLIKKLAFLEIEWRRQCPDVDLQDQLGWAHYWVSTNSKGSTYKDMVRFLNNWFKGCQKELEEKRRWDRRGEERRKPAPTFVEQKPAEDEVMTGEDFEAMKKALRGGK